MRPWKECPNCRKEYQTVLDRQHPDECIQNEFPDAERWEREQHISGICSDKCWRKYLGMK